MGRLIFLCQLDHILEPWFMAEAMGVLFQIFRIHGIA